MNHHLKTVLVASAGIASAVAGTRSGIPLTLRSPEFHDGAHPWTMCHQSDAKSEGAGISQARYRAAEWSTAIIPGTVQNSLMANGVHPQPRYGLNNARERDLIPDISVVGRDFNTCWFRAESVVPADSGGRQSWVQLEVNGWNLVAVTHERPMETADLPESLTDWPQGAGPVEIGNRVARRFVGSTHPNFGNPGMPGDITYPEVCAWFGALRFAARAGNETLAHDLEERFQPLFGRESHLLPAPVHVDLSVFGAVPLELYRQTGKRKYLDLGLRYPDRQWEVPTPERRSRLGKEAAEAVDRGLSWQTRLWIDDMFMISAVQANAWLATGERKYIDRAAEEMVYYLERLQQDNGLFHHAPDVPFLWGRGNGWMAAGMTILLEAMPADHPRRDAILGGYRKMMETLLVSQAESGAWRQLVDDSESWEESSATGMFTFAFITGVREGWLESSRYAPAARKGWLRLTRWLDASGDLRDVCEGTNKTNDRRFYLDRKRLTGDMHGQAPLLWCAGALLK